MQAPMYESGQNSDRDILKNRVRQLGDILRGGNLGGVGPSGRAPDMDIDTAAIDLVRALIPFGYVDAVLPADGE